MPEGAADREGGIISREGRNALKHWFSKKGGNGVGVTLTTGKSTSHVICNYTTKWLTTLIPLQISAPDCHCSLNLNLNPWWWRQYAPLKRRSTIILHGSTTQKTALNINLNLVTYITIFCIPIRGIHVAVVPPRKWHFFVNINTYVLIQHLMKRKKTRIPRPYLLFIRDAD
jgi:hypothetical protein